jgi:hypothetical protein
MSNPLSADEPLDPATAQLVRRVRRLMLISGLTTMIAVAAVSGIIGYRLFKAEGSATPTDASAMLPKGARVLSTAVSEDRIAVTIETGGRTEVHVFDLKTLKPTGRLRFTSEP